MISEDQGVILSRLLPLLTTSLCFQLLILEGFRKKGVGLKSGISLAYIILIFTFVHRPRLINIMS